MPARFGDIDDALRARLVQQRLIKLQRPIVQTDEIMPGAIAVLVYSEDRFDLTTIPMSRELVELIFGSRLKVYVEGRYAQHPLDSKAFSLIIDRVLPEDEEPKW